MTEDDAKTKWCFFARVLCDPDGGGPMASANRLAGIGDRPDPDLDWPSARCIGSACMAWMSDGVVGQEFAWARSSHDRAQATEPGVYEIVDAKTASAGYVQVRRIKETGTCGLVREAR